MHITIVLSVWNLTACNLTSISSIINSASSTASTAANNSNREIMYANCGAHNETLSQVLKFFLITSEHSLHKSHKILFYCCFFKYCVPKGGHIVIESLFPVVWKCPTGLPERQSHSMICVIFMHLLSKMLRNNRSSTNKVGLSSGVGQINFLKKLCLEW